jgi:nitrogen regulatory protein PII-like uncharacterized protein
MENIEDDILVAKFAGWRETSEEELTRYFGGSNRPANKTYTPILTIDGDHYWLYPDTLPYRNDWKMLMEVVEKIEDSDWRNVKYTWDYDGVTYDNFEGVSVEINKKSCVIYINYLLDPISIIASVVGDNKKEATFKAVVEFIKWLNKLNHDS